MGGLLVGTAALAHPVLFLASLFSFGVLLAFTAAQLAVIKLRFSDPNRRRPYRVPFTVGQNIPFSRTLLRSNGSSEVDSCVTMRTFLIGRFRPFVDIGASK